MSCVPTDSLTYCIKTKDLYKDMETHEELYDFSDYPKDHFPHFDVNKTVVEKFKDKLNGKCIYK